MRYLTRRVALSSALLLFFSLLATAEPEEENALCASDVGNDDDCDGTLTKIPPSATTASKVLWKDVREYLERVRAACGELCDTDMKGEEGEHYRDIRKEFDCEALFRNGDVDAPSRFPSPPARLPKYLRDDFLYGGRVAMVDDYYNDSLGQTHWTNWTMELFDRLSKAFSEDRLVGSYGLDSVRRIHGALTQKMDVAGKHVLVLGSQRPWLETLLLESGAGHIPVLDYVDIRSEHPGVDTITPGKMSKLYLQGEMPKFDVMVSFSSLEHSGLGMYGDALNPWGDLIAMGRAWCVMKPGGQALVGVPTGADQVLFNSARVYGPLMYSHLFANWRVLDSEVDFGLYTEECRSCYQPLHILERKEL